MYTYLKSVRVLLQVGRQYCMYAYISAVCMCAYFPTVSVLMYFECPQTTPHTHTAFEVVDRGRWLFLLLGASGFALYRQTTYLHLGSLPFLPSAFLLHLQSHALLFTPDAALPLPWLLILLHLHRLQI